MYRDLQIRLIARVRDFLLRQYGVDLPSIGVDQPPSVEFGEYALTFCFELAKRLRKAPRKIAEEFVANIETVPGIEKFEVAGAGYINVRVNRAEMAAALTAGTPSRTDADEEARAKMLVEHTSINPNKAAHIGHLRNAILGDTFVRLLRHAGHHVDVQNYIDNTGVQVADVVVGFIHLAKKSKAEIEEIIANPEKRGGQPFDYYCWDLYTNVSQWYEQNAGRKKIRMETLHAIEAGGTLAAEIGDLISTAVLRRHLETMQRLNIYYDFLPRESEILSLHFWELAFQQLKKQGVVYHETEGKNKGCWVMKRADGKAAKEEPAPAEEASGPDEDAKVIVRSNGTVTYVGKDIAYHLWKFGLLGRDFGYRKFYRYPVCKDFPKGHDVWISACDGEPEHPHFGGVAANYNVIDTRQTDPQNNVIEAIRALGYIEQAEHYTHFSYEMVALTPRCALEMGYEVAEEDRSRAYIEVSGRKGFGVKADDLLDALIASAQKEVDSRHPELTEAERRGIAEQIAIGALRYFMLKFTKNSVIAFDFKDALSFEGETGPYCQYAVVRASNIFRKSGITPESALGEDVDTGKYLAVVENAGVESNDLWELWLAAAKLRHVVAQCVNTTEPAYLAKYAFQLAQIFNNFYHRHHILNEPDDARKRFLMVTAAVARRELIRALEVMGISVPAVM